MPEYMGGANNSISNIKDFYIEVMSGLQEELEKVEFVHSAVRRRPLTGF